MVRPGPIPFLTLVIIRCSISCFGSKYMYKKYCANIKPQLKRFDTIGWAPIVYELYLAQNDLDLVQAIFL